MKNQIRLIIKASSILAMCIIFKINVFAFFISTNVNDAYWYTSSNNNYKVVYRNASSNDIYVVKSYDGTGTTFLEYSKTQNSTVQFYTGNSSSNRNLTLSTSYDDFYYTSHYYVSSGGDTNIIDLSPMNLEQMLEYISNYSENLDDLGYIKNVGYHVDAYGLENNPVGTNEVVSWGEESTSGIDLTQDKYSVEFMIKDTSMEFKNSISQSFEGFINIPRPLNSVVDFAADTFYNIASLFATDDDEKAFMQGKSVPAETYGRCISITTVLAKNKKASLATMPVYKTWASDGSTPFKQYVDSVTGASTRNDWFGRALEVWNQKATYYNLSYDIYARIIDTSSGNKGDWLLIDKHNTPYINSDRSDRLNGGVTAVTGIRFPDYNPTEDDFTEPPAEEPAYQPDDDSDPIYLPTPISTGYVIYDSGSSSSSSSSSTLINNYYNTTYVYNYGDQISNINIDNSDYNNFNEGIDTIKALPDFLGLYLTFFGSFLPTWAVAIVSICIPLLISIIIIRIVKGVLPFV